MYCIQILYIHMWPLQNITEDCTTSTGHIQLYMGTYQNIIRGKSSPGWTVAIVKSMIKSHSLTNEEIKTRMKKAAQ